MRHLKRYKFDELRNNYPVLSLEEQQSFIGGQQPAISDDCVLQVLAYLDNNPHHTVAWYQHKLDSVYNYKTSQRGGIVSDSIQSLGRLGGLHVNLIHGGAGISIQRNGRTTNGRRIMMTISGAGGANHAVVVTGIVTGNNGTRIEYHDPTTQRNSSVADRNFVDMYEVY